MAKRPYLGLYVKLYINSLHDWKIRQMDPVTRCFWMDALMLAKPGKGVLPPIKEIAFKLRMPDAAVRSYGMALVSLGLIDEDHIDGHVVWTVHAWDKWQSDSISTPRVRRHRSRTKTDETFQKRNGNVSWNANETRETNSNSPSSVAKRDGEAVSHESENGSWLGGEGAAACVGGGA